MAHLLQVISDFITSDPNLPVFELSHTELNKAIESEESILDNSKLEFIERSACSIITPSKDNYFDNETILMQFKRLFTMIRYSYALKNVDYRVDLLVDNATTHTKSNVDVNLFGKGINNSSPVQYLTWLDDNGVEQVILTEATFKEKLKGCSYYARS
ncbi:unnamed protein product [Brachionus calyciflorus]|uniref:Uncharacterized protein n=1 Tax=Brachionus calyciflorus TaxID=104777 RepID=A0A814MPV8_9BILA|nr:unnamed protein product [Brachionus calyciflorus]